MHSDFSTTAKSARAALAVPNVPLDRIVRRSRELSNRGRLRMIVTCGALALAAVAGGTVGTKLYGGIQFWNSGNRWAVAIQSLTIMSPPTAGDLRTVTASATFPVVYPVGLPQGAHLIRIIFSPADHPTSITVGYLDARGQEGGSFTLIDSRVINATAYPGAEKAHYGAETGSGLNHWIVGDETVLAGFDNKLTPAEKRSIANAMQSTSPAASLSAAEAMLWKIRMLGGTYLVANVADRLAGDKAGVLIDRGNLRLIPDLAGKHRPLIAPRVTHISRIPYVNNKPQFDRAKPTFDMALTIPADGVRAVAAVMAAAGESGRWTDCCEILYTKAENGSYTLWTLPVTRLHPGAIELSKSQPVEKYIVDAKTYRVHRM